jgi:DMSO reductase anchor subunit
MMRELDIGGVFFTPLLGGAAVSLFLWLALRAGLVRLGVYRWVWHPALFDLALLMLVFAAAVRPFGLLEV